MNDESNNDASAQPLSPEELKKREDQIKQLSTVICICKGINLSRVLKGLDGCETVADVNNKVGTGTGGCKGERCGPRIKILLKKFKDGGGKRS